MQWLGDTTWVNVLTAVFFVLILIMAYFFFFKGRK